MLGVIKLPHYPKYKDKLSTYNLVIVCKDKAAIKNQHSKCQRLFSPGSYKRTLVCCCPAAAQCFIQDSILWPMAIRCINKIYEGMCDDHFK